MNFKLKTLFVIIIAVIVSTGFIFAEDDIWLKRNSEAGAKAAYDYYKGVYTTKKDYDSIWKFARAVHFYAGEFIKDNATKKAMYTEAKLALEKATNMSPNRPEAWYYFGVCLGTWAELNGILDSLGAAQPIVDAASKVIAIDPNYEKGLAYSLRARVYHKAPAVISIGDEKKADADYKISIQKDPTCRYAFRFYAEFLIDKGRKSEAKAIIAQGLAIPANAGNSVIDNKEIKLLKELEPKTK